MCGVEGVAADTPPGSAQQTNWYSSRNSSASMALARPMMSCSSIAGACFWPSLYSFRSESCREPSTPRTVLCAHAMNA